MPIVYIPNRKHVCSDLKMYDAKDFTTNTIFQCDECGQYWQAQNPENYGNHWEPISDRRAKRFFRKDPLNRACP